MDRLIEIHRQQVERGVPVEIQAAWLHHRFTQIHPFAEGNGRVARALASLVFIKARWFPLIVKRDDWSRYIEALEKADGDDLRPLVEMFVEAQRDAVILAAELAHEVMPISPAEDAVAAVRDRLLLRGKAPRRGRATAEQNASTLLQLGRKRFDEIATRLNHESAEIDRKSSFAAAAERAEQSPRSGQFSAVCVLLKLGYSRAETLALVFNTIGPASSGLIGVLAYITRHGLEPVSLPGGTFLINYEEPFESAQTRYCAWLERVIVAGLSEWRRSL
jgi:prophage maintenance system killer protein